ncbi:SRPBCC family protein [Pseudoalteromonas sp. C2R02]|uniref:SRPBCC family protein n=1 Tax=Pseudoalteromonas sp. C2R02 TaxID=2841565 RepID=UPI001C09BE50|nr:SRPBCC family protein [Pseudoalteromonas sp. C2R02]MBU2968191.1 SRPBCC family protein [Pseudoalteromonas sp. C2R02]
MLRNISIALFLILATPFITALFVHNSYDVEREIVINQPKDRVFQYVKYLKNQNEFSKWANIDPNMTKTYRGIDGTIGFVSAWDSTHEEVGTGEQEIKAIEEGKRIDFELRFIKPFEATEPAYMITESVDNNTTKVKWGFSGHMDYPMNLMFLFIDFEKTIGDDLQEGLDNLKVIQERQ